MPSKRLMAERRARGVCTQCDEPRKPGRMKCERHLEIDRVARRKYRRKLIEQGLCAKCGYANHSGNVTCQTCSENLRWSGGPHVYITKVRM